MILIKDILPELPESILDFFQKRIEHLISNGINEFDAIHVTMDYYLDRAKASDQQKHIVAEKIISYFVWREVRE